MSGLEKALFQLKFTAKSLNRQAAKAEKERKAEEAKALKNAGNEQIMDLYARNAISKGKERIRLLELASRIDAVASRVQTAVTMRQVSKNMTQVVKGMDVAMKSMDITQIQTVMDVFERQFDDLDVAAGYYENVAGSVTATGVPQDEVDALKARIKDSAGMDVAGSMPSVAQKEPVMSEEEDKELETKLRMLRGQ